MTEEHPDFDFLDDVSREPLDLSDPLADRLAAAELLEDRLVALAAAASDAYAELAAILEPEEEEDDEAQRARLKRAQERLSVALMGGTSSRPLQTGDRVELAVVGKSVFPRGLHRRSGTIRKRGQTEWAWLVELDEPLGEHQVVHLGAYSMKAVDES